MIPAFAKRIGLKAGAVVASAAIGRRLLRGRGVIFMLHRFRDPDLGLPGHDPEGLRSALDYLRGRRYELVSLNELFRRLVTGTPAPAGAIAFTIDDGYLDQAAIGAPVFAEFDCPVTTFVTTGFVDQTLWFWWDRVEHVFAKTPARRVRARLSDQLLDYTWGDVVERSGVCADFVARCKVVSDDEKERGIRDLAAEAGVELPTRAPPEYAPMSWEALRQCETGGMSFGPHTVTHPVLARTDDRQSEYEIVESWRRLREEAHAPVPFFCYPNGQPGDYGSREMASLEKAGLLGSVVGTANYADVETLRGEGSARFQIPRFSWPDGIPGLVQCASGLERLKQLVLRRV